MRWLALALLAVTAAGCGLLLDTTPPPDAGPESECTLDTDCSRDACNGYENCVMGQCVLAIPALVCDDGIDCTHDGCADGACFATHDDALCLPGKACIPAEGGCVTPQACTDPAECDDGNVCTAAQDCVGNVCVIADGAMDLSCPAYSGCGVIGCDPLDGCVVMGTNFDLCAAFEDDFDCTLTECDPTGACLDVPSASVCEARGAPNCLVPSCDPGNAYAEAGTGCVFQPNDAFCASSDPTTGCATSLCSGIGFDGADSDGCIRQVVPNGCMGATCDLDNGLCTAIAVIDCTDDSECDDGDPCNGLETCDLGSGMCVLPGPPCQGSTGNCERILCDPSLFVPGNPSSVCVTVPGTGCFPAP